jgi:hypothetical protein
MLVDLLLERLLEKRKINPHNFQSDLEQKF